MTSPDLLDVLNNRMSMTDLYQPVIIRELLLDEGARTKAELANARVQAVGVCTAPAALVPKPSEFFLSDGSFVISPRTTLAIASQGVSRYG